MSQLVKAVKNPKKAIKVVLNDLLAKYAFLIKDDEKYLRMKWWLNMDYPLNLDNPTTFNEKLQWLKLHDHNPLYTTLVDKVAVKDYVADILGPEYIIPTLGVYDKPEDIDWDALPDKFVLKCTNDSNSVIICKDKSSLDKNMVIRKYRKALKYNYFYKGREWPYKNVPRRIIAEQFIDPVPGRKDLPDYKFFCFDGEVKAMFIATDRHVEGEDVKFDFFDCDFNHLPFRQGHENAEIMPSKPANFELMKKAASKLSHGLPNARVDFYDLGDKVYFGEVTLFHFGGITPFDPEEWDKRFGEMLKLPGENVCVGGVFITMSQNGEIVINKPDLHDYKFFCFDGEVKFYKIDFDRFVKHRANYYSPEGELLHFGEAMFPPDYDRILEQPVELSKMISLSEKLSKNIPMVRVDFYNVRGRILFGEMTFYPAGGVGKFTPEEWDSKLGEWLQLPN